MLFATKLNSSCSGRNVPRVGSLRSPVKRREFRLELAESRRIVPEWTRPGEHASRQKSATVGFFPAPPSKEPRGEGIESTGARIEVPGCRNRRTGGSPVGRGDTRSVTRQGLWGVFPATRPHPRKMYSRQAELRRADCRNGSPRLNQDDHAGNGVGANTHAAHHAGAADA